MNVLVTGGAGYIGSVLVPMLIQDGHKVTVIDKLTFGNNLKELSGFTLHEQDVLDIKPDWLDGIDAVIHLAGLSNDPMANFRPRDNYINNSALTGLLVYFCKQKGIKRFIFGSTCSIYGCSSEKMVDEQTAVSPIFPYGLSKVQAEFAIDCSADENFKPIIFRQATVYGWAPRMRFDLVVNTMTKYGVCNKKITVHNPKLWRPLVHVRDLANAYRLALNAPEDVTGTFNIVSDNYTILEIGREVRETLVNNGIDCDLEILNQEDPRSYRVNSDLARSVLGYTPKVTIAGGVEEILQKMGDSLQPQWNNPWFINAEVYRKKIIAEEKTFEMWKNFLVNFQSEFDHLNVKEWYQEGP
ncbi:MAG: SDR family oxidoreductase [Desulfuromonadaceae bacterium]|nr:SDR family oxidoreductase [Desulfuromonadaceae bacterium]MDD5106906.1 SDR family oxidoreductase [Desulfuromonadaceae bacterium]